MQSEIPEDVMKAAIEAYEEARCLDDGREYEVIARAIMAERERRKPALSAAEPVGQVDASYGEEGMLVASFKPNTLPIGTKLYAAPPAPSVVVKAWTTEDEAREYRRFSKWFKDRGYPGYPEEYSLVCENAMHAAWQEAAKRSDLTAQVQDVAGWQLVPKEPTYKMLLAGSFVDWGKYPDKKEAVRDVWNAMNRNADNSAAPAKQEAKP